MILYLDIETAPEYENYADMPDTGKKAFEKKFHWNIYRSEYYDFATCYNKEASLLAEYSKIICIGVGMEILNKEKGDYFYLKGFIGEEAAILNAFDEVLIKSSPSLLCAHNGKRFDYPFLTKRYLINGMIIPQILNTGTKKPWETNLIDTVELWRGLDLSSYVSLISLCHCLKVESSKTDLDGTMIKEAYYNGQIEDIKNYCLADVLALYRVHKKMISQIPLANFKTA